ncbi:transposase [Streptomyces sp. NPDC059862]|uniref:transposase n=1 Tax=Streptomyces sp. NPDC059862 TaxID=3346975 RepID=UPI00364E0CD5
MTAPDSLSLHALAEDNLTAASPDLLRAMVKTFADALMSAEADALCNAEYGQVSEERVNHRNGYRTREVSPVSGHGSMAGGSACAGRGRQDKARTMGFCSLSSCGDSTRRPGEA